LPLNCNFASILAKQNNPALPALGAGFGFAGGKILFTDYLFPFFAKIEYRFRPSGAGT
jgi:hypothetical protein